MRKSENILH